MEDKGAAASWPPPGVKSFPRNEPRGRGRAATPRDSPFRLSVIVLSSGLLFFAALAAAGQANGPRYALVVGNGNYAELGKLKNPRNDAADMAKALEDLGFEVKLLVDADLPAMEDAVLGLGNDLARSAESVGFFYYAGHGVQSGGTNYLIPADAHIISEPYLKTKALSAQAVLDTLQGSRNALNVVVLDACRDNPFSWARSAARGLTVVESQPTGSIVVYATSAGSAAEDGTGRNGVFTTELLKQIRTPGLEIKEVFNRTGKAVSVATAGRQVPAVFSQFFDSVYLSGGQGPVAAAAPTVTVTRSYGSILAGASTAGTLYLDGKSMGELPADAKLRLDSVEAGNRSLELRYPDGQTEDLNATVEDGKTTNVSFAYIERQPPVASFPIVPQANLLPPAALAWPTLCADSLKTPSAYSLLYCNVGAYGGGAFVEGPLGMRVRGIWTNTACWIKSPLSDRWVLSCQLAFTDEGSALLWLGGPGHGNSPRLGYCLDLSAQKGSLMRDGEEVSSFSMPDGLDTRDFLNVSLLRDGAQISGWINKVKLFSYQDAAPLTGVLHSYVAFGSAGGGWATGIRYRNLKIQAVPLFAEETAALARVPIVPTDTVKPSKNGRQVLAAGIDGLLGADWYRYQPEFIHRVENQLILTGPNATPFVLYRRGLAPGFAYELDMQYVPIRYPEPAHVPDGQAEGYLARGAAEGGFMLLVKYADKFPPDSQLKLENFPYGWEIMFPDGGGNNRLTWVSGNSESDKASTPYWTPMAGNRYTLRIELRQDNVRFFVNGALLLQTDYPSYVWDDGQKAFIGFQQRFEGAIVRAARIYQILD
jgi:hypothetical protein